MGLSIACSLKKCMNVNEEWICTFLWCFYILFSVELHDSVQNKHHGWHRTSTIDLGNFCPQQDILPKEFVDWRWLWMPRTLLHDDNLVGPKDNFVDHVVFSKKVMLLYDRQLFRPIFLSWELVFEVVIGEMEVFFLYWRSLDPNGNMINQIPFHR